MRREKSPEDELVFNAKMVSEDPLNAERMFIVRFSLADDGVLVWETETAGFRGGFFYRAPHYRTKGKFDPSTAYVGSEITVNLRKFLLVDAPDSTLNIMESEPDMFPYADLSRIIEALRSTVKAEDLRKKFVDVDFDRNGRILMKDALAVLGDPQLGLRKHQQLTIARRYEFFRTGRFVYEDFLSGF
jgi:hypothetical protein